MRKLLSILACLTALAAACSSAPPSDSGRAPRPMAQDCNMQMPGYPPCETGPYEEVPGDYYPAYGGGYYPGSGVVLVPVPVVTAPPPVTPPPITHHPAPPPSKHHRVPLPKPCHPKPGFRCP